MDASATRQITIVTPQGLVYDVEPTYIGATLGRLEGYRVAAEAHLVRESETGDRPVIRVASLTIFGRDRSGEREAAPAATAGAPPPVTDAASLALEVGGADSRERPLPA